MFRRPKPEGTNVQLSLTERARNRPGSMEYGWDILSTFIEGSKKYASHVIRENLPEMAAQILPPCQPLAVVRP